MDLARLPQNPGPNERASALEKLKRPMEEAGQLSRSAIQSLVLGLNAEGITKYTFSLAHIIKSHLAGTNHQDSSDDFAWLRFFLEKCDSEEIRWCDDKLEFLCRHLAVQAETRGLNFALQSVAPLLIALKKRLNSRWTELCSISTDVMQVCLVAKKYDLAVQLADVGAVAVSPRRKEPAFPDTLTLDLQRYFYYSGIAYSAMRRFPDALHALTQCLSLPAKCFGGVHMEAYKKYMLISLICHGKLVALPKYTPNAVVKTVVLDNKLAPTEKTLIPPALKPYHLVVEAFEKQDRAAQLTKVLEQKDVKEDLIHDRNFGLISHVMDAYWKNKVIQLTDTYVTLSLGDIATAVNTPVAATEIQLLQMIRKGEIKARLDQRTRTVRFLADSEDIEEQANVVTKIQAEINRVSQFAIELQALDNRLSTSKDYIRRLVLRSDTRGFGRDPNGDVFMDG